jgi:hypothetical protein
MDIAERTLQLKADFDGVYESGKKAEYNEFWDKYGGNGQYSFAGQCWSKSTFYPNRDFSVYAYTFYYHNWLKTPYDFAERLEELGITMNFTTNATTQAFRVMWVTRLPLLDFSKNVGYWDRTFSSASGSPLVTIDKIILPPEGKVTAFNDIFGYCSALKNITFEGVLDKSISFSVSPLSVQSLKNIISCLKDFSITGSEYAYTVTFKSSAFSALEAEGATAEYNGVACTWAELIDNKKWNLVKG